MPETDSDDDDDDGSDNENGGGGGGGDDNDVDVENNCGSLKDTNKLWDDENEFHEDNSHGNVHTEDPSPLAEF